ncbi:MAG: OmpH family outer membrane protein [Bacteroidota bacterium]
MKKRVLLFVLVGLLCAYNGNAQEKALKIGYTNVDYILSLMPEAKAIESDYKSYEAQLQKQLQSKIEEFQTKAAAFEREAGSMTEVIRADKQNELQTLQQSIQKFQREAEISLQNKQVELFQPAYKKITDAISDIAEENGYTHVFSDNASGLQVLLYATPEDDVSNLVLKKLGIDPPVANGGN